MSSSLILSVMTFVYGLAAGLYVANWVFRQSAFGAVATGATAVAVVGNLAGLVLRWIESYRLGPEIGHAPLSNLYESLTFFALVIGIAYLYIEVRYRNKTIGAFALTLAFLVMAYAGLNTSSQIQPLIPALKSNWLIAHVLTCFVGYAAFALAFGIGGMYLIKDERRPDAPEWPKIVEGVVLFGLLSVFSKVLIKPLPSWLICFLIGALGTAVVYAAQIFLRRLPDDLKHRLLSMIPALDLLDELNYQMVMFGFLFLTVGIITGAVWANSAWGRYWGWDPKETWSLITWFVYLALLHFKLMRGWRGRRIAYFSILGFAAVLFTYFGVNLLPGLHSYGAMGS